jgi:outer membrane biosynthesis protein TonB
MASKSTVSRAEFVAVTARLALVEERLAELHGAPAGAKVVKARAPAKGNAWSAFYGIVAPQITALIKGEYADDERWESEKGAEDGCKRAGFQMRVASYLKADADDGEGGYAEPDEDDIVLAVEYILDNPYHQSATAEARGGMSVTQLKAAGIKIAKPSAAKPVAKPVAKPTPVKKAAPVPEPEAESETEDEAEEAPAPVPAPKPAAAKKSPKAATKAAPKSAVLAAAAEVAEEVKEAEAPASALEEPTEDDLKEAGLVKFKNPNSKIWYLRTVEEPKRCYLGGPEKENIAKAWANFKAGICAGIWTKNDKGKLDICPVESSA